MLPGICMFLLCTMPDDDPSSSSSSQSSSSSLYDMSSLSSSTSVERLDNAAAKLLCNVTLPTKFIKIVANKCIQMYVCIYVASVLGIQLLTVNYVYTCTSKLFSNKKYG